MVLLVPRNLWSSFSVFNSMELEFIKTSDHWTSSDVQQSYNLCLFCYLASRDEGQFYQSWTGFDLKKQHLSCTSYIMDSLSTINTHQQELQMKSINQHHWCASPVVGSHFGQPCCELHSSGQVCLITGDTSGLRGPYPQTLTLFGGVRFIAWRLRRPSLGECRQGPETFLGLPDVSGQQPCNRTHLKNSLMPHLYAWWGV